jgi:hypothetical protein
MGRALATCSEALRSTAVRRNSSLTSASETDFLPRGRWGGP